MSNDTDLLTPEDLLPLIQDIARRMPDAKNPVKMNDGTGMAAYVCLYTDPNDTERHCIVGQLASEQGWQMPPIGNTESAGHNAVVLNWPVNARAAGVLSSLQTVADGDAFGSTVTTKAWGDIDLSSVYAWMG